MYPLWEDLKKLKGYRWVELSHVMNNQSPYWGGIPEGAVELGNVVYDWGNPMLDCQIQSFKFPGQFGTHIDFPGHFIKDGELSQDFGVEHMAYPLCVIDISDRVEKDADCAVTVEDIKAYEEKYGEIPDGAFVALRTDWYRHWPNLQAFANLDEEGGEHCPGWSMEALQYIYEVRNAAANGHETLDTDASFLAVEADDLACERYILEKGKIQIEVLKHLDKVPAAGAVLFCAWPRFEGANGLPVRVWAICPE